MFHLSSSAICSIINFSLKFSPAPLHSCCYPWWPSHSTGISFLVLHFNWGWIFTIGRSWLLLRHSYPWQYWQLSAALHYSFRPSKPVPPNSYTLPISAATMNIAVVTLDHIFCVLILRRYSQISPTWCWSLLKHSLFLSLREPASIVSVKQMFDFSSASLLLITAGLSGPVDQNQGILIQNIPQIVLVEFLFPSETEEANLLSSASLSAFLSFKLPQAQLSFDHSIISVPSSKFQCPSIILFKIAWSGLSRQYPMNLIPISVLGFYCFNKVQCQVNLGRKGFLSAYSSISQFITKGSQGRNSSMLRT